MRDGDCRCRPAPASAGHLDAAGRVRRDGADGGPGDGEDFADAAGEDHLAGREGEPASVLLADVAGHFKRVPAGPHQLGCAGRSTLPSVITAARHTLK
jgi:hypothetical protein